ncbi:MAG: 4Fe-4S dicluster domain-containing protein, partial [Acidobacteria bacterium]|nr:4Fe-4S dicluster domain-containing protein [Acidobacteriota bacterium]
MNTLIQIEQKPPDPPDEITPERREFLKKCLLASPFLVAIVRVAAQQTEETANGAYHAEDHYYGMGIDVSRCIGCGRCAEACKTENDVPRDPYYFRTWIERYVITTDGETSVSSPNGGIDGFPATVSEKGILRSFFVPKLCNQCASPPCVQVCPVGATFLSKDGVVLVDKDYCIGCR